MWRWLFAVGLLAVGPSHAAAPEASPAARAVQAGRSLLKVDKDREAEQVLRMGLEVSPDEERLAFWLGMAIARQDRCDEAREVFDTIRDWRYFSWMGFLAEGECLQRHGDLVGAAERFEASAERRPLSAKPWFKLARVRVELDELEEAHAAIEQLKTTKDSEELTLLARASAALGTPEFEERMAEIHYDVRISYSRLLRSQGVILDGKADLLANRPCAAAETLLPAARIALNQIQIAAWRAESLRRCGALVEAKFPLERPAIKSQRPTPLYLVIQARVATDEGDFDVARQALAAHPSSIHPEFVASEWYLARAEGRPLEALETKYETVRRVQDGPLELLIPLERQ